MSTTVTIARMDAELWQRIRTVLDSASTDATKTKLIDKLITPLASPAVISKPSSKTRNWLTAEEVMRISGRSSIQAVRVAASQQRWRKKDGGTGRNMPALYWREDALKPRTRGRKAERPAVMPPEPDPNEPPLPFPDIGGMPKAAKPLPQPPLVKAEMPPPAPPAKPAMVEVAPAGRRVERIIPAKVLPDADLSRIPGAVRHITFVKD